MTKNKEIKNFFSSICLFKDFTYLEIYNQLLYGNHLVNDNDDMLKLVFNQLSECNKKIVENYVLIDEGIDSSSDKTLIEISFVVKNDQTINVVNDLIMFLKKKKIKYLIRINVKDRLCYVIVNIIDNDCILKITDYINDKLGKKIEDVSPLIFSDEKVCLSFNLDYSYTEVLSMYLYKYLNDTNELCFNSFKKYILDNYFRIINQVDMHKFLDLNKKDVVLSKFFNNILICTMLITYLFNDKDLEDYCDYYIKLKKDEKKNINVYGLFDNLDINMDLFLKLVSTMYLKYGEEYTRNSIINYINSGKKDFITRENNLRKEIIESKSFLVFLCKINFDVEFNKIIYNLKMDGKKKILENVCKETFLTCNDFEKINSGKIHIARTLVRLSYGDYSSVTRKNDARKMAMDNIEPGEVVDLIKNTLKIDCVKKEAMLYELYAEYIEKCV